MKQERFPYYLIGQPGASDAQIMNESGFQSAVEAAGENQTPPPSPERAQTFLINEFESTAEFAAFDAPEEVKVDIINRAVRLKQQVAAKRLLGDPAWTPVEDVYDMVGSIAEVVERRRMSDEDKAVKAIEKLPEEARQALIERLLAQATTPQ